jgi:hypothetical protein
VPDLVSRRKPGAYRITISTLSWPRKKAALPFSRNFSSHGRSWLEISPEGLEPTMSTHEFTMSNLDEALTPSGRKYSDVLNSTDALEYVRWSVIRMKLRNCACYPIQLIFDIPHSEAAVREKIAQWVERGDREWREFRHFDIWPTKI